MFVLAVVGLVGCAHLHTEVPPPLPGRATPAPFESADDEVSVALWLLGYDSPTWRAMADSLRAANFRVLIVDASQAARDYPRLVTAHAFSWGEARILEDRAGRPKGALVLLDLANLRGWARARQIPADTMAYALETILAHEVYGHLAPELLHGHEATCGDPPPNTPAERSCVIQRENRVRAELGFPRRARYDGAVLDSFGFPAIPAERIRSAASSTP